MKLGVWMSQSVWRHKAEAAHGVQAWNLPELPDLVAPAAEGSRLYVATAGYWRGYFPLQSFSWNPADAACPFTLLFNPQGLGGFPNAAEKCFSVMTERHRLLAPNRTELKCTDLHLD